MNGSLADFAPHAFALLLGGLATSLGLTYWGRTARGRAWLVALPRSRYVSLVASTMLIGPFLAFVIIRSVLSSVGPEPATVPVWQMLVLGAAVGLPMALPGLMITRRVTTTQLRAQEKWRDRKPTEVDRRKYAEDLEGMIRELSPTEMHVTASVEGTDGKVLRLDGEMPARSGERLTNALRGDLKAIGFDRIEGSHEGRTWWSPV